MSGNKPKPTKDKDEHSEESSSSTTRRKNSDQDNKRTKDQHQQELLDEAIEESFPASDSPTASRVD